MTVTNTSLLGLALPTTGTESGVWGDDVNNGLTILVETSVAGTNNITQDSDITLAVSNGNNSSSFTSTATNSTVAQYYVLNCTGARTAIRNIIAPATSRTFVITNNTTGGFAIVIKKSGGTGVSIAPNETAIVYYDSVTATDYVKVSSLTTFGAITATSITDSGLTLNRVTYATTGGLLTDSANFTFNGTTVTMANDASIHGLTVGQGAGSVSTNTAVGASALQANTSGAENTALGYQAGYSNTTGVENVFVGKSAGYAATGSYSVAVGFEAGYNNTEATNGNVFLGYWAGRANTSGSAIVAVGTSALLSNTTGQTNTAVGRSALQANTTASNNTAVGYQAGYSVTTGTPFTALGYQAGLSTTTATWTTAIGYQALRDNTTGGNNTAVGRALVSNTTASDNTAMGMNALYYNTTGAYNTAFGSGALFVNTTASNNTAQGYQALYSNTTSSNNTAVGYQALYSQTAPSGGQGNLAIGYKAGYSAVGGYNCFVGTNAGLNSSAANGSNNFIGYGAGSLVTSGYSNTILGSFPGNQGGLDIRTASNYIVLSDGDGNPRWASDNTGKLNSNPGNALFYAWNNERSRGSSYALEYLQGYNASTYSGYTAEYESAVEMYQVVSTGSTLTIPITNQGSVWCAHQVRIRGIAVNYNQTTNLAFTADMSLTTATSNIGFTETHTGNISSISMSSTNIVITFTTAYAQTTSSQQVGGVIVYIEHLVRNLATAPIVWSSVAMN